MGLTEYIIDLYEKAIIPGKYNFRTYKQARSIFIMIRFKILWDNAVLNYQYCNILWKTGQSLSEWGIGAGPMLRGILAEKGNFRSLQSPFKCVRCRSIRKNIKRIISIRCLRGIST